MMEAMLAYGLPARDRASRCLISSEQPLGAPARALYVTYLVDPTMHIPIRVVSG